MKTRFAVIAVAFAAILLLGQASAEAQVRIGLAVQFNAPPPSPRWEADLGVDGPAPDAVWVRGHWSWDGYAGRYVWISGHRVGRHLHPGYHERKLRHIPHGVARGWWKKQGRTW
jgi:hypothetical protein